MRWTSCTFTRKSVIASGLCATKTTEEGGPGEGVCAKAEAMAQKKTAATFRMGKVLAVATDFMSNGANNNCAKAIVTAEAVTCSIKEAAVAAASSRLTDSTSAGTIRHLYVHIPFCKERCSFCGCNVAIARSSSTADPYLASLLREMDAVCDLLGSRRSLSQIHWGGGTPTFLDERQIAQLFTAISSRFFLPIARLIKSASPRLYPANF